MISVFILNSKYGCIYNNICMIRDSKVFWKMSNVKTKCFILNRQNSGRETSGKFFSFWEGIVFFFALYIKQDVTTTVSVS